jgi:hypothetical protein
MTLDEWLQGRAMKGKDREYARFLWMLDRRGLTISLLAAQMFGKDEKGRAKGRSALNEALLGRRPGGRKVWPALKRGLLNVEEYECIHAFASAQWERRKREGITPGPLKRLREENAALKAEVAALRERVRALEPSA